MLLLVRAASSGGNIHWNTIFALEWSVRKRKLAISHQGIWKGQGRAPAPSQLLPFRL